MNQGCDFCFNKINLRDPLRNCNNDALIYAVINMFSNLFIFINKKYVIDSDKK